MVSARELDKVVHSMIRFISGLKPKNKKYYFERVKLSSTARKMLIEMRKRFLSEGSCPLCGKKVKRLATHLRYHHFRELATLLD